jgi:eukaryotic-like serine/threonine-protein kinase
MIDVGSVLHDTYRIVRRLGSGGMGVVYAAEHVRLPKQVAVKVLRRDHVGDTTLIGRFRREAELCSRLGHPNIVEVRDFNVLEDGSPYLVMELLEGESLGARLKRVGALPLPDVLRIACEVADGLTAVHAIGVVHRDLKPENLFLCRRRDREILKILDFGISKVLGAPSMTRSDGLFGTPGYMSPEQARGELERIDARTDQFALAAILYEALAGRPAFVAEGDTPFTVLFKVVNSDPLPLFDVPPAVSAAIFRGLAKEPDDRFASVAELPAAFAATGGAAVATPAHAPAVKRARWRRVIATVFAVVATGGAAALLVARPRPARPPAPPVMTPPATAPLELPAPSAPSVIAVTDRLPAAPVDAGVQPSSAPAAMPAHPARPKRNRPASSEKAAAKDDLVDPYAKDGK